MAKAKEGYYYIETDLGVYDLVTISNDSKEIEVLNLLKNSLLKEGEFRAPKNGSICLASIAAFIMYLQSTYELQRQYDPTTDILN